MNTNKSLVIATGYRKKFVGIEEILKDFKQNGNEDTSEVVVTSLDEVEPDGTTIYKMINEDGSAMWFTASTETIDETVITYFNPIYVDRRVKQYEYDFGYPTTNNVILDPRTYNKIFVADDQSTITFEVAGGNYELFKYIPIVGRIQIGTNVPSISLEGTGIYTTDEFNENSPLEAGHIYEYNIFDEVMNIIDVTYTTNN